MKTEQQKENRMTKESLTSRQIKRKKKKRQNDKKQKGGKIEKQQDINAEIQGNRKKQR